MVIVIPEWYIRKDKGVEAKGQSAVILIDVTEERNVHLITLLWSNSKKTASAVFK